MSLLKKINDIPLIKGQVRITGILKQYGSSGCILNASINGEQKTTINYNNEEVPKISTECLTNGIFKHRIKNLPVTIFESKKGKSSIEDIVELFEKIKFNRVELRGGSVMSNPPLSSEKALRVDEAVPYDNNKDYFSVENRRLGIKGDNGDNDYPRQQILFKNLKMFFSSYLDLNSYHPRNNSIISKMCEKIDSLPNDKESNKIKEEVSEWLDKVYPVKQSGELDVDLIISNLTKEIQSYEHPVHKRYNSFLIMSDLNIEKLNSVEDFVSSLEKTKHHHGL